MLSTFKPEEKYKLLVEHARVTHPNHGEGTIEAALKDGRRCVLFDNGQLKVWA